MKIKIKTYLKLGILLFGVSFILVNCQKEESFNEDTPTPAVNESDIQINRLSLTDLKNNKQLSTTFNKFEKHLDVVKRSNTMAKINSSDDSFVILTDEILQTTTSTSETYTFKIETPSYPDATFENFVIEKIPDEELFNLYIFSYYTIIFDDNSSLSIILSVRKIHESEINMDDFDGFLETNRMLMIGGCLYNVDENNNPTGEPIWCFGTSGGDGDGASTGNNSNSTGDTVQYISNGNGSCTKYIQTTGPMGFAVTLIEYNVPCPDNTNDSTDNSNNNNNGDNSTGDNNNTDNVNDPHFNDDAVSQTGATGSSSSSNTPNTTVVATIPTVPPEMVIRDCLGDIMLSGTSNVDISGWLDNATVVQEKAVANYLNSNSSNPLADGDTNCDDPVALGFVELAIEAMLENGEVDWANEVILDSTFVSNEKTKCVYNKLKNLSNTVFNDIINDHFDSSKNAHIRFKITTPPLGLDAFTKGSTYNGKSFFEIQLDPTVVANASTIEIALMIIHESIHAELLDRCVQLGIINAFDSNGNPNFTNTSITYTTYDSLFAILVYQYKNYNGGNSQWNHDLFTVLDYRTKMAQNLVDIHTGLNDPANDFLSNVNNDPLNSFGNFTLEQLMDYISWIGLEGTQDFINNIQNNSLEQTKKNYIENAAREKYTQNCN
jgi:hypothetical protein